MSWKRRAFILQRYDKHQREYTYGKISCVGDVLYEGKAVFNAGPCSSDEAQHATPNPEDGISAKDILEPPLRSVIERS